MTRKISSKDLRVGDWLAKDVSVKNKTIKFSWDGLNQQDINFLKKNTKFILVKEGIPYALAFLFAAIIYYFRNFILILLQ